MGDRILTTEATPADLIRARCRAFAEGDFGFIYDSYHGDSTFRRQFPDRHAYLKYGETVLGKDFSIEEFRILREDSGEEEARVIFALRTSWRGARTESIELALLIRSGTGWRYHSSQKLTPEEVEKPAEEVDFEDFERVREKVFF